MLRADWDSLGCTARLRALAANDLEEAQRVAKFSSATTHSFEPWTMCGSVKLDGEGMMIEIHTRRGLRETLGQSDKT
jgi:hypothetical protein